MTVSNHIMLEDVLDLLLDEFASPTPEAIAVFSRRYPQHRAELLDFAAAWSVERHLPPPPPLSDERLARIEERVQLEIDRAFMRDASAKAPRATTLAELAAASGQDLDDVAARAGLDASLVWKLDARRIRAETIPARLAVLLAEILRADVSTIRQNWVGVPSPPASALAAFMSINLPEPLREDFAAAVATSGLSPEEKAALLSDE